MLISTQNNQILREDALGVTADNEALVVCSTEVRVRRIRLARRRSRAFTRSPDAGSLQNQYQYCGFIVDAAN